MKDKNSSGMGSMVGALRFIYTHPALRMQLLMKPKTRLSVGRSRLAALQMH